MHPWRPIPQTAYNRMKNWLVNHPTLHFFLHNSYCRLLATPRLSYTPFTYEHFSQAERFGKPQARHTLQTLLPSSREHTVIGQQGRKTQNQSSLK